MKRCPICRSRKWRENQSERGKWKCFKCGFEWWNPTYHKTIFSKDFHIGHEKSLKDLKNHEQSINNSKDKPQLLSVDFHNNVYKFKIKKDNPDIKIGIQVKKWNSRKEILSRDNITYIRTTRHIQISTSRSFIEEIKRTSELDKKEFNIRSFFIDLAKEYQNDFNMTLDLKPVPVMKDVKPIEAFHSPVQFFGNTVKCVYENGDIEWIGRDAVDNFKNFLENMSLETKADQLMIKMDGGFNTLAFLLTKLIPKEENPLLEPLENLLNITIKLKEIFE